MHGEYIMNGSGGGTGTRGGGVSTRGGIHMQQRDSHNVAPDNLGRRESQESISKGQNKKIVEERETIHICGRHVIVRGGKGRGVAGSNSRVARGDEMADMAGVFRNTIALRDISDDMDEYDYDEDDGSHQGNNVGENDGFVDARFEDGSIKDNGDKDDDGKDDGGKRLWIKRVGRKFACGRIHRSAISILQQKFDGDWITFSKVPYSNLSEMFDSFRTQWRWDLRDDQHIFDGFVNMLKDRYPDIMNEFREASKGKATEDGHVIPHGEERFDISTYPHDNVPLDK
ncbi:hypothetical protein R6Q57_020421 [Mikania cordata]